MNRETEELLERIERIYQSSSTSQKKLFGVFTKKKTVEGLEGIANSEMFSDRLWETNNRLNRKGRVTTPSRKATVMIFGNHSAGKSSFINWYCESEIQTTGIALETLHFTMVTKGFQDHIMQPGLVTTLYPMFKELILEGNTEVYPGFLSNLDTKISSSNSKKFQFVDFIDTPGLTDGQLAYKCDMNVITWLAGYADLVFVFFDPIGQALCKKTLNLIKEIFREHSNKVKFCLTKIDEIKKPSDFNKLISQISLNISQSIENQINSVNIVPICLPDRTYLPDKTQNNINHLTEAISKAVDGKVQSNFKKLKNDLLFVDTHLKFLDQSDADRRQRQNNLTAARVVMFAVLIAVLTSYSDYVVNFDGLTKLYVGIALALTLFLTKFVNTQAYSMQERGQLREWRKQVENAYAEYADMEKKITGNYIH